MATIFRLPHHSLTRRTYGLNPGLREDPIFGCLGNQKMWSIIAYVDHYSPYRLLLDYEDERELLKIILTKAGYTTGGVKAIRRGNVSRKIIDGEDPAWNAAVERYKEIQGVGLLDSIAIAKKHFVDFLSFKVNLENPEHEWIAKEKRQIIAQRILSKIIEEENDIKLKSGKYRHVEDTKADKESGEDDVEGGYDPDATLLYDSDVIDDPGD